MRTNLAIATFQSSLETLYPGHEEKMPKQEPRTGIKIGYARVSTRDQNPQQQIDALLADGVDEDNLFVEHVSGVAKRRPRLEEAMAKVDQGDLLVVWKLDRFGRSIIDLLTRMQALETRGVGFKSLTDAIDTSTPAGRFMLHSLAAVAQFERDLISERTRAGMKRKIKEGYRPGPTPVLDTHRGQPRKRALMLREAGLSVPQIAEELHEEFGLKVSHKTLYNQTVAPGKRA